VNNQQKILVTGAFGFLGWKISHFLHESGYSVLGIGRGKSRRILKPAFPTIEMHMPDPQMDSILKEFAPDCVVHCASPASVPFSVSHPHSDFMQSAGALSSLLDALRRNSPSIQFILISSASVYGNPVQLPVGESHRIQPISPYGFHKHISETLCNEYETIHGFETTIVRLFSAYGFGLRKQVVWDIFQKIHHHKERVLNLFGTGEESRDFLHVNDVANAIQLLISKKATGTFNLGSGEETSIRTLCETICDVVQFQGEIEFSGETRTGDPMNWCADISKIQKLGFKPVVSLKDGLSDLWKQLRIDER